MILEQASFGALTIGYESLFFGQALRLFSHGLSCMQMKRGKSIFYVCVQGVIFILYLVLSDDSFEVGVIGQLSALALVFLGFGVAVVALIHLNRNISPFPIPRQDGILVTSGIYHYIRHPMYTGIILIALGFGLLDGSMIRLGLGAALWAFLFFKSEYEEKLLADRYPEYKNYREQTGKLFPRVLK